MASKKSFYVLSNGVSFFRLFGYSVTLNGGKTDARFSLVPDASEATPLSEIPDLVQTHLRGLYPVVKKVRVAQ